MNKMNGLAEIRENLNLENISSLISRRGDTSRISRDFGIDCVSLNKLMNETKILSILPNIEKSKANVLSTFKIKRELKLFTLKHDIKNLQVRQLRKKVNKWKERLQKNPKILLTSLQYDLILGSVIGDACVRQREKNCNFRVSHSKKQENYLLWKYNILKEFTSSKPYSRLRDSGEEKELFTFTHTVFNYYRNLFYEKNTKIITRNLLDLLNPRSLAIWVCDDGSYNNKQGYIVMCTNSFSLKEHKIMKKYFNEVWGLDPTIGFRDNKYYYLRFKQDDSEKLIDIIKLYIPKGMKYKIGEKE